MRYNIDARGTRYCDIFPEIGKGDINVTVVEPGAVALWHRHKHQTDYQFVIQGSLKIGMCNLPNPKSPYKHIHEKMHKEWEKEYVNLCDNYFGQDPEVKWHYASESNAINGPVYIPAGLWHGCYNYTNEPAILIYHITNKWDGTDEERCHPDDIGWKYLREAK